MSLDTLSTAGAGPGFGGERTPAIDLGFAGADDIGVAGPGAGIRTIVSHVILHDKDSSEVSMAPSPGAGERRAHARAGRYQLLNEIGAAGWDWC